MEGNPFTVPEIQTLLDGITVGGRKVSKAQQVLNQKDSLLTLFEMVEQATFALTPEVALKLQSHAARGEALEEGVFRTGKVSISGTTYQPPVGADLRNSFAQMADASSEIPNLFEKAMAVFLFVAHTKCFSDGNKRTGRLLMNGLLLQSGQDILSIPAARRQEFNEKMIRFYESAEATEMMTFLSGCQVRSKFE
ncbi:MAG: Fic family protein [Spartobacteria bacterium]